MARRRSNTAADFVVIVARLPWWAALVLGFVSYLVFHTLAAPPRVAMTRPDQIGGVVSGSLFSAFAMALQYVIPILCLAAAVMSAAGRRKREALVSAVVSSNAADALDAISWQDFELLVGEAFRLQGFAVDARGGAQADGGVDLVVRKGSEKFLVQCKQWKALKVTVAVVRELYGVMAATGAAGGFVVTSGDFTPDAAAFAKGRSIQLVNGSKLTGLLRQAQAVAKRPAPSAPAAEAMPSKTTFRPICPDCSGPMLSKRARRGANAGSLFWGCASYPSCKGTRPA